MVTDRVGPTITTLKAEVDYLDGEVKKLLTLLADARTESMRLRAALRNAYEVYAGSDGFIPETAAEGYQQQIIKQMVDCICSALEEGMTSPDEREDCTGLEDSSTANPCGREDCEEEGRT